MELRMINSKYTDKSYTILPLLYNMDLSECALEQALIQHKFKLEEEVTYMLVIGREQISELLKIKAGYNLFNIEVEVQEDLKDEWYLVNEVTKTIVYSPGA